MSQRAVITADIVGSTLLAKAGLKKLMKELDVLLAGYSFEFFRGDSFQVYVKSAEEALPLILKVRAAAVKHSPSDFGCDIKSAIGIGEVKSAVRVLHTATDEAFVLSGRAFDTLKPPQRLLFSCSEKNKIVQLGLQVSANFIDYVFRHLTVKQAAVVSELLQNKTQTETAKLLKKSQATINKHVQAAGWPELERLLANHKQFISALV